MAKKRKASGTPSNAPYSTKTKFDVNETFDDSEDDFYTGRDKILLDAEPAVKRRKKIEDQERDLQPSDEEVLGYESADDTSDADSIENDDEVNGEDEGEIEEDGENWGTIKADYYNADVLETEADALEEEAEARRLQQKQLKNMTEADFGFDEMAWADEKTEAHKTGPVVEKLPDIKIPKTATKEEKLKILQSRYPEFQPLTRDFMDLQETWMDLNAHAQAGTANNEDNIIPTKLQALSAYLGSIAMYFAVLASTTKSTNDEQITALPPGDLRDHAIIENLMKSRQIWDDTRDLKSTQAKPKVSEVTTSVLAPIMSQKPKRKASKQITDPAPQEISSEEEIQEKPKTKQKKKEKKFLDLQSLLKQPAVSQQQESDFGDEAPLTVEEAAEKAKKKKSLRFYTSQIAQKANKRGAASRDAGGDDDVPRKERMRDKQERLLKEAENRGRQKASEAEKLGGADDDMSDHLEAGDEYYEAMKAQNKLKKAAKQARADAYAEAARSGGQVYEEEQVGTDGKRAITYQIEKNKGLMPRRKKEVRNSRVKKRNQYEAKKKKLGSMRQVYKGGEGRGGYGGELTGIKTNVVKSVKL